MRDLGARTRLARADVKERGFARPVVLDDEGLLLDGGNRLAASWDVQLDAPIVRFNPSSPVEYVLSENLQRRHLDVGQKAMIGLDALPLFEAEAAQRAGGRPANGEKPTADLPQVSDRAPLARDLAAKRVGVSGRAMAQAKRITEQAPELSPVIAPESPNSPREKNRQRPGSGLGAEPQRFRRPLPPDAKHRCGATFAPAVRGPEL